MQESLNKRFQVDPSGKIMVLERSCPWKDHLFDIEAETQVSPAVIYVLFPDGANWRVQCVPQKRESFDNRLSLLWKGLRDEGRHFFFHFLFRMCVDDPIHLLILELSKASGIAGGIFVHATGFIGGNKTYEGALEMARKSLKQLNN